MQATNITIRPGSFADQLIKLTELACKKRIQEIAEHLVILEHFQADIDALKENDIHVQVLPEKNYVGGGYVRATIPVYTEEFQKRVCHVLFARGFEDTPDSTMETRIMQRDTVIFIVTTAPPKASCSSTCSHHCKCKH